MKLDFRILALFTALVFLLLAVTLMSAPDLILSSWGVGFSSAAGLMARRFAALSAGIAVMFFMARNAEHSAIRTALIQGITSACTILAFLGIYEFSAGHANNGIFGAVFIEVALALAFLYVMGSNRKATRINRKPRTK
ncbi:MAG: hypothetical protein P4L87_19435 [Formivibrio sp.]|nr:hypothetical protein [Formivibrio sp.]